MSAAAAVDRRVAAEARECEHAAMAFENCPFAAVPNESADSVNCWINERRNV